MLFCLQRTTVSCYSWWSSADFSFVELLTAMSTQIPRTIEFFRFFPLYRVVYIRPLTESVKLKVKFTLEQATKVQRYSSTLSLTSALDVVGGQRHAPAALPPVKTRTHCTGGWVTPRSGLDECRKFHPHCDSIPGPSGPCWVAIPTQLFQPLTGFCTCIKTIWNGNLVKYVGLVSEGLGQEAPMVCWWR